MHNNRIFPHHFNNGIKLKLHRKEISGYEKTGKLLRNRYKKCNTKNFTFPSDRKHNEFRQFYFKFNYEGYIKRIMSIRFDIFKKKCFSGVLNIHDDQNKFLKWNKKKG